MNKFIGLALCVFFGGCDAVPSCSDSSMTGLVMDVASDDNNNFKKYIEISGIEETSFDEKVKTKLCVATIVPTEYTKSIFKSNSVLDFSSPYNIISFAGSAELSEIEYLNLTYKIYYDEMNKDYGMKPLAIDASRLRDYVNKVSSLEVLTNSKE